MSRPAHLELDIDRLVLHGMSPFDRRRVAEALERELGRLFAIEGFEVAHRGLAGGIDLGSQSFEIEPGLAPEEVGARVARAVWASSRQAVAPGLAMTRGRELDVRPDRTPTRKGNLR